jgi:hypothetical protein
MDKLLALFKSRRFWVAVAGVLALVFEPFGLDAASTEAVVLVIAAWIVGDSIQKT